MGNWARDALLTSTAMACMVGTAPAHAQSRAFDVPAQAAETGIAAFGRQADIQIVAARKYTRGKRINAVRGEKAVDQGLAELLAGTGLIVRATGAQTYMVLPLDGAGEAQQAASSSGENTNTTSETNTTLDRGNRAAAPDIVVTASLNTDIRRYENDPQPRVVFGREEIDRSGSSSLEGFLRSRLTSESSFSSNNQLSAAKGNLSSIDLRGLGADETLILIDGRRAAGAGFAGVIEQPDLNNIPMAAVERIEVLPTTASGIYGGGATGGVINIILRRDYQGAELRLAKSVTADGGGGNLDLNGTVGLQMNEGQTSIMLSGSYRRENPLLGRERNYFQRKVAHVLRNAPGVILAPGFPPLGRTANISSLDGSSLTLKDGRPLGSAITFIPQGYAGALQDGGTALIANAGNYNLAPPDTAQRDGERATLLTASKNASGALTVRNKFGDWFDAFVDAYISDNRSSSRRNFLSTTFLLPASAPTSPFAQDVNVTVPGSGLDDIGRASYRNYRLAAGGIIDLGGKWKLATDYTWSRTRGIASGLSRFIDSGSVSSAVSSGALDLLNDDVIQRGALRAYSGGSSVVEPARSTLGSAALRLSGPLPLILPGGAVEFNSSLEHRTEHLGDFIQVVEYAPDTFYRGSAPSRSQAANSAYAELKVPLIGKGNTPLGIRRLELQLALRHDRYTVHGANQGVEIDDQGQPLTPVIRQTLHLRSTNPTVGLLFQPVSDVTLRGSFGTGFLPPAVHQIAAEPPLLVPAYLSQIYGLTDSQRGGEALPDYIVTTGGNQTLKPERSKSWSAGLIATPRFIPDFRLSVDWTKIDKSRAIYTFFPYIIQADLDVFITSFPERITRAPPSPGDPFSIGPITAIDSTLVNVAKQRVEALDFAASYDLALGSLGDLAINGRATYVIHNQYLARPSDALVENAGVGSSSGSGGVLRWRASGSLTWSYDRLTASWTTRFVDSYYLNLDHSINVEQGSAKVPHQVYHDLYVSYRLGSSLGKRVAGLFSGVEVALKATNLFNKTPPVDVTRFYSTLADPRKASYQLELRTRF